MNNVAHVVDRALASELSAAPDPLRSVMGGLVGAGGKRLRPKLVVLAALATGPRRRGVMRLAVAAEAVHSATLLHDDVIDLAPTRRGAPSAPATHGNALAVLAGDWLLTLALELVRRTGLCTVLDELVLAIRAMVEAEALQQHQLREPAFDEARCLAIVRGKTASLFRWCALAGSRAAGAREAEAQALAAYAGHVGVAFQLADDLVDLGSPATVGEDLAQGCLTLPLVLACQERAALRSRVLEAMRSPAAATALLEGVHHTHAVEAVVDRIRSECEQAAASLAELPPSPYREQLSRLAASLTPQGGAVMTPQLKLGKFVKFREEKFGGVLFETRQERVFSLNPTAAAVLKEVVAGTDVLTRLKERFDDKDGQLAAQVGELLNHLEQQGLLVRAE